MKCSHCGREISAEQLEENKGLCPHCGKQPDEQLTGQQPQEQPEANENGDAQQEQPQKPVKKRSPLPFLLGAIVLAAAAADFVICLYNPSSKKRHDYLQKACDLILQYQPETLVCATVSQIGRDGEEKHIYTLKELRDLQVDMFTTVFIGNSQTREINGCMVTPRGYRV